MKNAQDKWIIDNGFQRQKDLIDCLAEDIGHPDRHWVAVGLSDKDGFAESVAYCHPINAPLISSAPELLAALQELLSDKYLSDPINEGRMANARAAIAKATEIGL